MDWYGFLWESPPKKSNWTDFYGISEGFVNPEFLVGPGNGNPVVIQTDSWIFTPLAVIGDLSNVLIFLVGEANQRINVM